MHLRNHLYFSVRILIKNLYDSYLWLSLNVSVRAWPEENMIHRETRGWEWLGSGSDPNLQYYILSKAYKEADRDRKIEKPVVHIEII